MLSICWESPSALLIPVLNWAFNDAPLAVSVCRICGPAIAFSSLYNFMRIDVLPTKGEC